MTTFDGFRRIIAFPEQSTLMTLNKPLHITRAMAVLKEEVNGVNSPLRILAEDGYKYIIKTPKPKRELDIPTISEFICHYLLKLWKIRTPHIAGIFVNPELIRYDPNLTAKHSSSSYNGKMCFGSRVLSGAVDYHSIMDDGHYWTYRNYLDPRQLLWIGLFDLWVINSDRLGDNSNMMLTSDSKGRLQSYAIDHTRAFNNKDYRYLAPNQFLDKEDSLLQSRFAKRIFLFNNTSRFKSVVERYYWNAIDECKESFQNICNGLPQGCKISLDVEQKLKTFLFNKKRNEAVVEDFFIRLKS